MLATPPSGGRERVAVQESLFGDVEPDARGLRAKDAGRARAGETTPLLHGTKEAGARQQRAAESMDKLRKKFGRTAIVRASLLGRERIAGRDGTDGPVKAADVDGPPDE